MTREEAIRSLEPTVRYFANGAGMRLPSAVAQFYSDDILQAAWIGAIHAVDRYDKSAGVTLRSFAKQRIRGEIIDFLRREDFLTRDQRREVASGKNNEPQVVYLDHPPIDPAPEVKFVADVIPDPSSLRAFTRVECSETVQKLIRITPLSRRLGKVLIACYWKQDRIQDIGDSLGVSESRAAQMRAEAVSKLRNSLRRKHEVTA